MVVQQSEYEPVPMWDAGVAGDWFIFCATVLVSRFMFLLQRKRETENMSMKEHRKLSVGPFPSGTLLMRV